MNGRRRGWPRRGRLWAHGFGCPPPPLSRTPRGECSPASNESAFSPYFSWFRLTVSIVRFRTRRPGIDTCGRGQTEHAPSVRGTWAAGVNRPVNSQFVGWPAKPTPSWWSGGAEAVEGEWRSPIDEFHTASGRMRGPSASASGITHSRAPTPRHGSGRTPERVARSGAARASPCDRSRWRQDPQPAPRPRPSRGRRSV